MESENTRVIVEDHGPVWQVRINAPERRNALGMGVVTGLLDAAERVAREPGVRAVVLSGNGPHAFCAGADLKERQGMPEPAVRAFVGLLNRTFDTIAASPKVWIAALHGVALGGGLELALACDLRVARAGTVLGLPEARLGILPGAGGTQRLPRLIGIARAKALILTGSRIDAERAEAIGLVNAVADDHLAAADALAAEVTRCAPVSLTQAKAAIDQGFDLPIEAGLRWERACYAVTIPTQDRLEALAAFAEKRDPVFRGE
ncbi:MAG: enoyl-CoA hydratase/isomerase family protein [Myxococcales bacterium]|nr:enoyl-CoA hydratase/isomerase family protein [Myxococcales bacterium]